MSTSGVMSETMMMEIVEAADSNILKPHIFDPIGFRMIIFCILLIVYETYRAHSSIAFPTTAALRGNIGVDARMKNMAYWHWFQSNKFFESFVTRRKVLCGAVVNFAVFVLGLASLFNIMDRSVVIPLLLKFLFLWFISAYIFSFFYNLSRIKINMSEEDLRWYGQPQWFGFCMIARIISTDEFRYASSSGSLLTQEAALYQSFGFILEFFYYYPYYYFYTHNGHFHGRYTLAELTQYTWRRNIFLLIMLIQSSLPLFLSSVITMATLGTPKWLKAALNIRANNVKYVTAFSRHESWGKWIFLSYVVWYFLYGNCTYYASYVLLLLGVSSAMNSLNLTVACGHAFSKSVTCATVKLQFMRYRMSDHFSKYKAYYMRKCEENNEREVALAVTAHFVDLLEAMMDKTGRSVLSGEFYLHRVPWGDTVYAHEVLFECYLAKFGRMYIDHFVEELRDENMINDYVNKMINSTDEIRDGIYAEGCRNIMPNEKHRAYWFAFIQDNKDGDNADGQKNLDIKLSGDNEYYVQYFMRLMRGDELADTDASDHSLQDTESVFSRDVANYGLSPVQESRINFQNLTGLKL